jgi:hypothetical protein
MWGSTFFTTTLSIKLYVRVSILYNNTVHQVICAGELFFSTTLSTKLYVKVCNLLVCGGKLHDRIISLRRGVRAHTTFCWGTCAGPREWRSYICVWGYSFCFCFYDFSIRIVNCSVGVIFFSFYYLHFSDELTGKQRHQRQNEYITYVFWY